MDALWRGGSVVTFSRRMTWPHVLAVRGVRLMHGRGIGGRHRSADATATRRRRADVMWTDDEVMKRKGSAWINGGDPSPGCP